MTITIDPIDNKRIIREYYKQLCAYRFENLDENDPLLERHNRPKLTQEEIDDLNRPVSIKNTETTLTFQNTRPRWVHW